MKEIIMDKINEIIIRINILIFLATKSQRHKKGTKALVRFSVLVLLWLSF